MANQSNCADRVFRYGRDDSFFRCRLRYDFVGDAWRQQYGNTSWINAGGNLNDTQHTGCALCHTAQPGACSWNPYGLAIIGAGDFTSVEQATPIPTGSAR